MPRKSTLDIVWNDDAISALRQEAGCGVFACDLIFFGEMETEPSRLFRHSAHVNGKVAGGDIRIDNYRFSLMHPYDLSVTLVAELKRHHERMKDDTLEAWDHPVELRKH